MSESPKVAAAHPKSSSNAQVRRRGDRRRARPLLVWTTVAGAAVFAIALVAGLLLATAWPNSDWIPVYQDVLRTSFAALAVGGLGGLARLILDQRKAQEVAAGELRDRRYRFISTLVEVIYDIETAKLVIRSNRSVKSWTNMVNDWIILGCSRLADMTPSAEQLG